MSDYQVKMYLWPGSVGHMAIELRGPNGQPRVVGFGPASPKFTEEGNTRRKDAGNSSKSFYGPGTTDRDDEKDINNPEEKKRPQPSRPISLTKEQFERFNKYADAQQKNPDSYFALGQNCVEFVRDGLEASGKKVDDLPMYFTPKQLKDGGAAAEMLIRREGKFPEQKGTNPVMQEEYEREWGEAYARYKTEAGRKDYVNELRGSGKPVPEWAQKQDPKSRRPEIDTFVTDMHKPPAPHEEALLKPVRDWSQGDAKAVMAARLNAGTLDTDRESMAAREREFFDLNYGAGPARKDATGRLVSDGPVRTISEQTGLAGTKQGRKLAGNFTRAVEKIARAAENEGLSKVIGDIQRGLNLADEMPRLKPDGIAGPKTTHALRKAIATTSPAKVDEGRALGEFQRMAEDSRRASDPNPAKLAGKMDKTFGSLFRSSAKPKPAATEPKPDVTALQETLNDLGPKSFGKDQWKPLKEDGWIGPKTNDAFSQVAKTTESFDFTSKFGKLLGFG